MPRKKKTGDSMIKETAEQQQKMMESPTSEDAESVVEEGGVMRTPDHEGGMFVPGVAKPRMTEDAVADQAAESEALSSEPVEQDGQPVNLPDLSEGAEAPAPGAPSIDAKTDAINQEIRRLEAEKVRLEAAIHQKEATPTAPTAETPMFGAEAANHVPLQPRPQGPQQPQPQEPSAQPAQEGFQPDPTLPAHGYIAMSRKGQGYVALVIDGLTQADLDYIDFMAKFMHSHYPEAVREAHPAPLAKFALNHLLRDIRQELAESVHCNNCRQEYPIKAYACPHCGTANRCTQCGLLIGNGNIYI